MWLGIRQLVGAIGLHVGDFLTDESDGVDWQSTMQAIKNLYVWGNMTTTISPCVEFGAVKDDIGV